MGIEWMVRDGVIRASTFVLALRAQRHIITMPILIGRMDCAIAPHSPLRLCLCLSSVVVSFPILSRVRWRL